MSTENAGETTGEVVQSEVLVVGAGSAGISFALEAADAGHRVDLYTKESSPFEDPESSSSVLLAGGYAAVPFENGIPLPGDSFETHVGDTITVGGGINSEQAVRHFIRAFPGVIRWMERRGIQFDRDLHVEGSHSANRVYHVSDRTGQTVMSRLGELTRTHPNITVHTNQMAIDLISRNTIRGATEPLDTCLGAYFLDVVSNRIRTVLADVVVVGTGGMGKVFLYTSNPDTASGDGFAMCYRLGLPLVNMEFVQFHPTVYYDPSAIRESERRVLFTEALRGQGAFLKLSPGSGEDFVLQYDPRGSRASRDVVTRAEDIEMKKRGLDHVWLDCTPIDADELKRGFQTFYDFCMGKGIDPIREPVPVVYAAHYSNGGVLVNVDGATIYPDGSGVRNLHVVGETAYTGLHGATRLASNSGPEAIAMSLAAARSFLEKERARDVEVEVPAAAVDEAERPVREQRVEKYWEGIRTTMTKKCGIARDEHKLLEALSDVESLAAEFHEIYWDTALTKEILEVRNLREVALLILSGALSRKETRACHIRTDHPETNPQFQAWTVVRRGEAAAFMPISASPPEKMACAP